MGCKHVHMKHILQHYEAEGWLSFNLYNRIRPRDSTDEGEKLETWSLRKELLVHLILN
jgi:hypothetical protein